MNTTEKQIINQIKSKKAVSSILTILGTIIATAIIVYPLSKWSISLFSNIDNAKDELDNIAQKLEAATIIEDKWQQINAMSFDEFSIATDKSSDYGKYIISEKYKPLGIYDTNTGKCSEGNPIGTDDKACRIVNLSIKSADGKQIIESVEAIRVVSPNGKKWITEEITETSVFTCPVTGTYDIIAIGGGGGGGGGICIQDSPSRMVLGGGSGGGSGGQYVGKHFLKKGTKISITIGKGGVGGVHSDQQYAAYVAAGAYTAHSTGGNGGNTIVEIKGKQYIGYGGLAGRGHSGGGTGGAGGDGILPGAAGITGGTHWHGAGGASGAVGPAAGIGYGAGGGGGSGIHYPSKCTSGDGTAGHAGAVIITYQKDSI